MPTLAETQLVFREALVGGDTVGLEGMLVGGCDASKRIAIHRRNYEVSLTTALLEKFPGSVWLAGTPFVSEAARQFIHENPPHAPCIAEYGEGFPLFLSTQPGADRTPYLREFAELEWHAGHVTAAASRPAVLPEELSAIGAEALPDTVLTLQPGVRYLHASWPVDELMRLYVMETAPDSLAFAPADVWLQVHGARGEFRVDRLDAAQFLFRKSISEFQPIGDAAQCALDADSTFDPGRALAALVTDGLVMSIMQGLAEKNDDGD